MATTQFIGARYVPVFADPIDWSSTRTYEPLTIVYNGGNSYTSRQSVPAGIDISDTAFWALTGNYNAQIEAYRKEVLGFDGRINKNAEDIASEVAARMAADSEIKVLVKTLVENEAKRAEEAESNLAKKETNVLLCLTMWPELSSNITVDREINNGKLAKMSKAIISVDLNQTVPIDNISYAVQALKKADIELFAFKFHGGSSNYDSIDSLVKGWDSSVKTVFIYNEFYDANFKTNINSLQSKGYTVGVSFNIDSYRAAAADGNENYPDIIGVNMYPSGGYNLHPTRNQLKENMKYIFAESEKPIYVTEIGILPYPCFYANPEFYDTSKGYPFNSTVGRTKDYNVMKNYYSAAIESLNGICEGVCLWYWEQANEDVASFIGGIQ